MELTEKQELELSIIISTAINRNTDPWDTDGDIAYFEREIYINNLKKQIKTAL